MSTEDLEPFLISELIEQVFERIENRLSEADKKELTYSEFLELDTLFKTAVVTKAFEILDKCTITSYRPEGNYSEVIEISGKSSSPVTYKLFPNINYCNCRFFIDQIVDADEKLFYTCEHVLAARLASILSKLNVQVVAKHQFSIILKQIAEH